MAENDEILYESLDSTSPEEDMDEYITVSTPLPYLCPEVPHRLATPTSSPQPRGSGDAPLLQIPREELKLKSPIQVHPPGEGQVGRKTFAPIPIPAPYKSKGERPVPPNKVKRSSEKSKATSPISRPTPTTDYHRLVEDNGSKLPPQTSPKPPRLPKPKPSLKSSQKKPRARYAPPQLKADLISQDSQQNAAEQDLSLPKQDQCCTEEQNEDDVYYDKVLSRTKWRNILKRKKMKMASKKPFIKSASVKPSSGSYSSALPVHRSMSVSSSKKEFEYSDDELKLKAGNPRVICILLSIIIIALMVAVVSLTVSLVSLSSVRKLGNIVENRVPIMNCSTRTNSSSGWKWRQPADNSNYSDGTIEVTQNMDTVSLSPPSCVV